MVRVNIERFVHADAFLTMASTPQKIGALVSDIDNNVIYISALVVKNINFCNKQMYDRLNVLRCFKIKDFCLHPQKERN
jgi:hypothetical protein